MSEDAKTDRELLELAARAAGIALQRSRLDDPLCRDFLLMERREGDNGGIGWNPLTDDGDALRLAVRRGVFGPLNIETFRRFFAEEIHADRRPTEATRRAIVHTVVALAEPAPDLERAVNARRELREGTR